MDKKMVIIIPNELETNLRIFHHSCDWHQKAMFQFVYHNDLNLYGKEQESADTISKCLADQGFCTILIDEYKNNKLLIVYIPSKISPKQLEYFTKRLEGLKNYTIFIALREENSNYKIIDQTRKDESTLDILIKELFNRLIKTKAKSLKRTNNKN